MINYTKYWFLLLAAVAMTFDSNANSTVLTSALVASGLNEPVYVASPPGTPGTLFILEQHTGLIKILRNGQILSRPFLNIHDRVINTGSEQGLLGLAFHPNYVSNGYFYVNYIDYSGNTHISRFQVSSDPDSSSPGSEYNLMIVLQPYTNHNGGMLAFGPNDGYLYIGLGDGGSGGDPGNRAQNDSLLLGKMLRIDVNNGQPYGIPPGNPFAGIAGARPEIWAKGLRNPWRYSFDSLNGNLYIGDVGQDLWEEIDYQPASSAGGENYGWRLMEGFHCYNPPTNCDPGGLTMPIDEYGHNLGCAIVGGYVYRGGIIQQLDGTYFYGDYCSARIWSFRYNGISISDSTERTAELAPGNGHSINGISSFGLDGYNELFIVDYTDGEIYKIIPRNPGAIQGRVIDSNRQPLSSVIVNLRLTGVGDTTDNNGNYFLGGLGDGTFAVSFSRQGQRDSTIMGITVIANDTTTFNLTMEGALGISGENILPGNFALHQNYPNPFNAETKIQYELPKASDVTIEIYDILGQIIKTFREGSKEAGQHEITWDASNIQSGIYFYRITAGDYTETKKMVLLK